MLSLLQPIAEMVAAVVAAAATVQNSTNGPFS